MPPQKKKSQKKEKKWGLVHSGTRVGEVRKKGKLRDFLIRENQKIKSFSTFEAAEKFRRQGKVKNTKAIPFYPKPKYMTYEDIGPEGAFITKPRSKPKKKSEKKPKGKKRTIEGKEYSLIGSHNVRKDADYKADTHRSSAVSIRVLPGQKDSKSKWEVWERSKR